MKPKIVCNPKMVDHSEMRAIYNQYLVKAAELSQHQVYAELVAKATHGLSQTPVQPLATFGTNGGPLRCDQCLLPIILEGGNYHGVYADEAWAKAPPELRTGRWMSYIKGGMVVRIVDNGTLRIYHGYPQQKDHCCSKAERELAQKEREFVKDMTKFHRMAKFLEAEFPHKTLDERNKMLSPICSVMFEFDPGIGVNKPCGLSTSSN